MRLCASPHYLLAIELANKRLHTKSTIHWPSGSRCSLQFTTMSIYRVTRSSSISWSASLTTYPQAWLFILMEVSIEAKKAEATQCQIPSQHLGYTCLQPIMRVGCNGGLRVIGEGERQCRMPVAARVEDPFIWACWWQLCTPNTAERCIEWWLKSVAVSRGKWSRGV